MAMTAKQLKEWLNKHADDDAVIVLSSDSEGNTFSPLDEVSLGEIWQDNGDTVDVLDRSRSMVRQGNKRCITLWPMR